jgi:hypothetical protein
MTQEQGVRLVVLAVVLMAGCSKPMDKKPEAKSELATDGFSELDSIVRAKHLHYRIWCEKDCYVRVSDAGTFYESDYVWRTNGRTPEDAVAKMTERIKKNEPPDEDWHVRFERRGP